jgi:hypothetical protein
VLPPVSNKRNGYKNHSLHLTSLPRHLGTLPPFLQQPYSCPFFFCLHRDIPSSIVLSDQAILRSHCRCVLGFLGVSGSIVVLARVIWRCVVGFDSFFMLFSRAGQPTNATLVF